MDIKKPQLVKVEAFAVFLRNSSATPSSLYYVICPGTPPLRFGVPGYYLICVLRTPVRDIEWHVWGLCGCGCLRTRMPGTYDAPIFRLEPLQGVLQTPPATGFRSVCILSLPGSDAYGYQFPDVPAGTSFWRFRLKFLMPVLKSPRRYKSFISSIRNKSFYFSA